MEWELKLQKYSELAGALRSGVTQLTQPLTISHYENWLDSNHHADMEYLKNHLDFKKNPLTWQPLMRSAFVFAFQYHPHPEGPSPLPGSRLAMYASGQDYHFWMKDRLQKVIDDLKIEFPEAEFQAHTDSSPVLERDLAARAGLGWFGKNTCLIHPQNGSLFLIGEILTSLDIQFVTKPVHDFCGTCTKCMDSCPTAALTESRQLVADKCISYWTIESRKIPPENIRNKMGDWLFGCDICQTVCPWNQKAFKRTLEIKNILDLNTEETKNLEEELRWILSSSNNQIQKKLMGSPLLRTGGKGLKRNTLIVCANRKITALLPEVQKLADDEFLGELAKWCEKQLKT